MWGCQVVIDKHFLAGNVMTRESRMQFEVHLDTVSIVALIYMMIVQIANTACLLSVTLEPVFFIFYGLFEPMQEIETRQLFLFCHVHMLNPD